MSAKWVRSQQWDDRHLTGALYPVKVILRTFSHISTAVFLLSLVALYGILASIPIGLLAKIPTLLFYALTLLILLGLGCVLPIWAATRFMKQRGAMRGPRFTVGILGSVLLALACIAVWWLGLWPHLRYDSLTGSGVRFFGAFADKYQSIQFRRLPIMEMSELEFYSWWPLRLVLFLFVLNLVVATIRRIEFTFPRIGVLTVHTGIVTIALGSIYYTTHKQEGDMILLASGARDDAGRPIPGAQARGESGFYDNTRTALWVTQDPSTGWDQRPLSGVPRYNDYNLDAVPRAEPRAEMGEWSRSLPPLDIRVPGIHPAAQAQLIDADITFRIVGYASYCDLRPQWIAAPVSAATIPGLKPQRIRSLEMVVTSPMPDGTPPPRKVWNLLPDIPAQRAEFDMFGVEYTIGMPDWRWEALSAELPPRARHVLAVEIPGPPGSAPVFKGIFAVQDSQRLTIGDTGYTISVKSLRPAPPMPLVTKGYEGATSSLAIVRVEPPPVLAPAVLGPFDRWVYSRFPEISQDFSDELTDTDMPKRTGADPAIRITYVDATQLHAYFDELPDGSVRALVRTPGASTPAIFPNLKRGDQVQIVPMVAIRIGDKSDNAARVEVPEVFPPEFRDREKIGNHQAAAVAVEVTSKSGPAGTYWVPFTQYLSIGAQDDDLRRTVRLADGRMVTMAFGRIRHEFWPPMLIRLHEFEMIPYEHTQTPKDYRSDVIIETRWPGTLPTDPAQPDIRRTSLNNPLLIKTPYVAPDGMPLIGRALGRMMSVIAPNQYKFAQAGWDQQGWKQSSAAVARGELPAPFARFTILGVGNNPGIYIIAAGAIMMSIGIPWAFYLKPWLMQREKRKIQDRLAREGSARPAQGRNGTAKRHEHQSAKTGAST